MEDNVTVDVIREPVLNPTTRVLEEEPQDDLVNVTVEPDSLLLRYSQTPSQLPRAGEVVVGTLGGGYMRHVDSVTMESPTTYRVATRQAGLTDVFNDIAFNARFSTDAPAAWVEADQSGVGRTSSPLLFSRDLLGDLMPKINEQCAVTLNNAELRLTLNVGFDADVGVDIADGSLVPFRAPTWRSVHAIASIQVSGKVEFGWEAGYGATCDFSFPFQPERAFSFETTFPVGGVPVVITHRIGPELYENSANDAETGLNVTASFGFYGGKLEAALETSARMGFRWDQTNGTQWVGEVDTPRPSGTVEMNPAENATNARVSVTARPGMRYEPLFYGAAGPSFGLHAPITLEATATTCGWQAKAYGGLNGDVKAIVDLSAWTGWIPAFLLAPEDTMLSLGGRPITLIPVRPEDPWVQRGGTFNGPECDCAAATNCMECGERTGCGFCDGQCQSASTCSGRTEACNEPDPCESKTTCDMCVRTEGCGFCAGRCQATAGNDCGGQLATDVTQCTDCSGRTSCGTCLENAHCGWCESNGGCFNTNLTTWQQASCSAPFAELQCQ